MNDMDIVSLLRFMRNQVLTAAVVDHGMSWDDASSELDALVAGNEGAYTARIQAIIKGMK